MGSNFIRYLLDRVPTARVTNLDLLTYAANPENLQGLPKKHYALVRGDIVNGKLLTKLMRSADMIINFAAETHVDRSIHGSTDAFIHTNVEGAHSLLEALRQSPHIELAIHISTDEVWGDLPLGSKLRFTESSPFKPSSPYAASKAAGDLFVRAYVRTYKLPILTTHSTNNIGPRQYPEKLIPFFITRAARGLPLPLYGDGRHVRDWLHVDDHSAAVLTLLMKGSAGEEYAISNGGKEYNNTMIARRILTALQKPANLIHFVADRPGHDRRYAVSSKKLRSLGWKPRYSVEQALAETIRWYRTNPLWITRALKRTKRLNPHIAL